MPAYYSYDFYVKKASFFKGMFRNFVEELSGLGFKFTEGIREHKDNSIEEIIEWNEQKIADDYELGYEENSVNDFKQCCFDYNGYSHVRLFILNYKEDDYFQMFIIIPEDEVVEYTDHGPKLLKEREDDIRKVIKTLWNLEYIDIIQTSLEHSDEDKSSQKLLEGARPNTEPYAIIPKKYLKCDLSEYIEVTEVERDALLLRSY